MHVDSGGLNNKLILGTTEIAVIRNLTAVMKHQGKNGENEQHIMDT